jgi:hypothetical protein
MVHVGTRASSRSSRWLDLMAHREKYGLPDDCDLKAGKLTCR